MATKKTTVKETVVKETVNTPVKEEVKEAPVKEAVTKKAPAKKAPAKTTAAKTTKTASVDTELFVQFAGNEVSTTDIVAKVKAAYIAEGHKDSAIKAIKLYIKPEDGAVYYVINDKASGRVTLF